MTTLANLLPRLQELALRFTAIVVTAFPLMLLGVVVYALLQVYLPASWLYKALPRSRFLAIPVGALLGFVVPVCDCGVVPAARGLLRRGLGLPGTVAFVLGAPVINPLVFFITAIGFGFNYTIAFYRLGLTFVVAVLVGWLVSIAFADRADTTGEAWLAGSAAGLHEHRHELPAVDGHRSRLVWAHVVTITEIAGDEFLDLGRFLIIGALVAAAIQTFVPQGPLFSLSQGIITSTVTLMALAVVLSICSFSDAPVAASFLGTFTPGAIFAFLLFGQMFDLKNAFMLLATFRRQLVIFMVAASAMAVLAVGVLINLGWI
jgi:uncharacterized membrane protein YraQ (UPF0718 family)